MDNLNELGKILGKIKHDTEYALTRDYPKKPLIHRIRDIFDSKIPFDMEFEVPNNKGSTYLNLFFTPPPPSPCAGGCFSGICEVFMGTDTILTLSYDIINESIWVYRDEVVTTNYTITTQKKITLGFTPSANEVIKVCYVYHTCIPV